MLMLSFSLTQSGYRGDRFSLSAIMERAVVDPSLGLDVGRADHFAPLLSFLRNDFGEVGRRAGKRRAAHPGKTCLQLGIGKAGVNDCVELLDDFG